MRKLLGVTGLLALLVIPMTGSASATLPTTKPIAKTVCADVKVAANVNAGANIGLYGTVLKKSGLTADATLSAELTGDVYVRICVTVDAGVALTIGAGGLVQVGTGENGCIDLHALADLQAGLAGGNVSVTVDVLVGSDKKKVSGISAALYLAPLVKVNAAVLADVNLCIALGGDKEPPPEK